MKILIADDEDYTREGLMEEIAWEEFGIDEIMQAVNGEEALKIVKWFRPDIILSDIRMPKMDGIAFAEEMVRLIPGSKLIFMSGYMETDYLKSAIRLSVIDYIEKPVEVSGIEAKGIGIWREDSCFEVLLSYSEKARYRLAPLYQRILERWPESKLAVGIEAGDCKNIYNSCKTARAAMNCAFYQPDQRAFEIDEAILQKRFMEPGIYGSFLRVLPEGPKKLSEWFQSVFGDLASRKYYQKEQVYTLMISLLTAVFRQYPEICDRLPRLCGEEQLQAHILGMDSLREMQDFTEKILGCVQEREKALSGCGRVIRGVVDYIAAHYGEENLSNAQIAEYFHFSPAYMNVLFKREMKVTLKQYLSSYRLERAKRLLEQDYMKITEIAEKCGYANANYFAKVFRDSVGMTPVEYRESCEAGK